ncbi:MAG: VOC family protein [Acidobacteriota bacterium]
MTRTHHLPGTFCWFECGTRNAAATTDFYKKLFGWNSTDVPMPGEMAGKYTLLKMGEDDIAGLYQMAGPRFEGVPSHWMTFVTVEDVDGSAERARALGGKILAPPMDVPGVGRMAVLEDSTGAKISVFKPGDHPGSAPLVMISGTFGWSELATRDTRAAKAFYTELFGWRAKTDETGAMPYTEFMAGGKPIGGMLEMTARHGDLPPYWLPYVMVEDTDAIVSKVGPLGGRVTVPATDIPGVGRFAVFAEPKGAVLAVIKLDSGHS